MHFGGNWTASNIKDCLEDVTCQEANFKIEEFNTILALTYHINYYVNGILNVFEGRPLGTKDKYSFEHPIIRSQESWDSMIRGNQKDVEKLAKYIEEMPDSQFWMPFVEERYGNYCRNVQGLIEHSHYHLGQIVIIKKLVRKAMNA